MIKKKEIVIAVIFFLLGLGLMYASNRSELALKKEITRKIIDNCIQSLTASNSLINSCSDAYKEASACITKGNDCNMTESAKKLDAFNEQRQLAEEQIRNATKDMDSIIESVISSKN